MDLNLHPHARQSLKKLTLPGPLQKRFANVRRSVDLSESTNPHSPYLPDYPKIDPIDLKQLYLNFVGNPYLKIGNMLFTVGSVDGLDLILRGFAEPNKDVICLTAPTFSAYEHWVTLYDLPIEKVFLKGENFSELMIENIQQIDPKIFILCNPNNPTGTVVTPGTIEKICQKISGLVIIDEAYIEFSTQPSVTQILHHHENLIILRTLSKAWGMAGARCGVILADERIINTLLYVQAPFSFAKPSQDWVHRCLMRPTPIYHSWKVIRKDRDHLMDQLRSLPCIEHVYPSQANFIMAILKNFDQTLDHIHKSGIYVADCNSSVPKSIKISISTREQNQSLIEALKKIKPS